MKTLAEIQREHTEQIKAFRREKGAAYLVKVYEGITEYTGQRVHNSCCSYVIPTDDAEVERLCKEGNMEKLEKRVDKLGGICLVWY